MIQIALIVDTLLTAFAFGGTAWFFFVQSPALLKWMGKDKFMPIQMRLTKVLFKALSLVIPVMFASTLVHGQAQLWLHVVTAGVAMFGVLANAYVVVPQALKAGGKRIRASRAGTDSASDSVSAFASTGGGKETKLWHRLVVFFVLVMMGGLISHGVVLMTAH